MARRRERPILIYHKIGDYPPRAAGLLSSDFQRGNFSCPNVDVFINFKVIVRASHLWGENGPASFGRAGVFGGVLRPGRLHRKGARPLRRSFSLHGLGADPRAGGGGDDGRLLRPARGHPRRFPPGRAALEDGLGRPVRYYAYMEGYPEGALRRWFIEEGFEVVLTQCPTFRWRSDPYRIGRIQVDDGDPNILITKASDFYLFFKDTRVRRIIWGFRVDRLMHRFYALFEKERGEA